MKIGLYIEHGHGNGVGGAELMMAFAAATWGGRHEVDLIHHRPPLTRERLEAFTSLDLSGFAIRAVEREPDPPVSRNLLRRYRAAREWHRELSEPYDLFVACTHWLPPFSCAGRSVLLVLFPFYVPPGRAAATQRLPGWRRILHAGYYDFEWRRRLNTYNTTIAISEFSRLWTRRRWGIEPAVIAPPVDVDAAPAAKDDLIVSVGRFSTMAHTKKQLEMMGWFSALRQRCAAEWNYACVGGLNSRDENHAYFAQVRELGHRCGAQVEANLSRADLKALLGRARIFWHATGFGEDTDSHPELAEHFGIATVEAMAAGCVPVVIDKGGQSEIVEHGKSGFLWRTPDELEAFTRMLMSDSAMWAEMSAAAIARSRAFSQERFVARLSAACGVDV